MQSSDSAQIRNAALAYLARRDYCYRELKNKLVAKKSWLQDQIDLELERLSEEHLLSDRRYADMYVRSRAGKGFGPDRIAMELQYKGIDSELTEEALQQTEVDWHQVIREVWLKKFRRQLQKVDQLSYQDRAKQSQFLRYRGFYPEQIANLLSGNTPNSDNPEQ